MKTTQNSWGHPRNTCNCIPAEVLLRTPDRKHEPASRREKASLILLVGLLID